MNHGWKIYRDYQAWADAERLFVCHTSYDGKRSVVQPLALQVVEPGLIYDTPTLASPTHDTRGFLQAALNCAWEAGLRPMGFADHAHELKAVRYHLEDMRALAKVPAALKLRDPQASPPIREDH